MRRIFQNVKQNASSSNVSSDKELKGVVINVSGLHVTIEGKIAEGGFSFVYIVRCNKTNRLYALKRQFVNEPRLLEACKREIEITRTLGSSHPNIVGYVSSSLKAGPDGVYEYLLVTNYYKHSVLQMMNDRLAIGKNLTVKEILRIFSDVCCAVARLHHCQTPVIHRDLKVENLLLEPAVASKNSTGGYLHRKSSSRTAASSSSSSDFPFTCVLCDFGSCTTRHVTPGQPQEQHTVAQLYDEIGRFTTLSYRAPEMVDLYSGHAITTKADIWALGVMLYKLCYFTLPFGESTLAIQSATFTFPTQPDYPAELQGLIVYCLTPDPVKRPDIFQVSSLVFQLSGRECQIKNLNNSERLSVPHLLEMLQRHQNKAGATSARTFAAESADGLSNSGVVRAPSTPSKLSASSCNKPEVNGSTRPTATMESGSANVVVVVGSQATTSVVPRQRPRVQNIPSPAAFTLIKQTEGPWKASTGVKTKPDTAPVSGCKDSKGPFNFTNPNYETADQQQPNEGDTRPDTATKGAATLAKEDLEFYCREGGGGGGRNSSATMSEGQNNSTGHRRNVSDPLNIPAQPESDRCSAFRPYHSQQQVSAARPASSQIGGKDPLPQQPDTSGGGGVPTIDCTSESPSISWNPFDLDDKAFGLHFDELPRRRGSASSIANVKSRESLVMEDSDPFGAAPFPVADGGLCNQKNQKSNILLNTLNLNHSSTASKSKRSSKYEKLINYLDDFSAASNKNVVADMAAEQQPAAAATATTSHLRPVRRPIEDDSNLTKRPGGRRTKHADEIKYKQMGMAGLVRPPNKDSEVDSVGSASDLQARMQASSTTDDEDGSDRERPAQTRKIRTTCSSRRRNEAATAAAGDDNGGNDNDDEEDQDGGAAGVGADSSSYDLDLNLDYSPGGAGDEPALAYDGDDLGGRSMGRRPLLMGAGDDYDDDNDSPSSSYATTGMVLTAAASLSRDNCVRRSSSAGRRGERLEMNILSPSSVDTVLTVKQMIAGFDNGGGGAECKEFRTTANKTTAFGIIGETSGDRKDDRCSQRPHPPSPIFPASAAAGQTPAHHRVFSDNKSSSRNVAAEASTGRNRNVFADAPFSCGRRRRSSAVASGGDPTAGAAAAVDKQLPSPPPQLLPSSSLSSSGDEAALVTMSPKRNAAAVVSAGSEDRLRHSSQHSATVITNQQLQQHGKKVCSLTGTTPGCLLLGSPTSSTDLHQPVKRSAFINSSFQGDDGFKS